MVVVNNSEAAPHLYWTPRFSSKYYKYVGLAENVLKKTSEILKITQSGLLDWQREFERLKDESFKGQKVVKTALTHGDRLIFVIEENRIIYVDLGDHDVMQEYSRLSSSIRNSDLSKAMPAPIGFMKKVNDIKTNNNEHITDIYDTQDLSEILKDSSGEISLRWKYEEELDSSWIHFLDTEQILVRDQIVDDIRNSPNDFEVHYLVGGPGTGKTTILINIANFLEDSGLAVSLEVSPQVKKYLETSGSLLPGYGLGPGPGVTFLIDDPGTTQELALKVRQAKSAGARLVIIAIDPFQWTSNGQIENYENTFSKYKTKIHPLWTCYRQSRNIGSKTIPFIENAILRTITNQKTNSITSSHPAIKNYLDLLIGMQFVDEGGYFKVFENDLEINLVKQIDTFSKRIDKWSHTNPVCFIYSPEIDPALRKVVKDKSFGLNRREISFERIEDIRGIEFQEVFILLTKSEWSVLINEKNFEKKKFWETATGLHIAFSRAKDGLALFISD